MNKHLLVFEFENIKNRKKNIIVFSALLVILVSLFGLHIWINKNSSVDMVGNVQFSIDSLENAINSLPKDNDNIKNVRKLYEEELEILKEQLEYYKIGDWAGALENQIRMDKTLLVNINKQIVFGEEPKVVERRIALNEEYLARDIQPMNPEPTEGFYFLKSFLGLIFSVIGFSIFIFLIGDSLAHDMERKSIKLLLAQGFSRISIYHTKLLAAGLLGTFVLLTTSILALLLGSVVAGPGAYNYPIQTTLEGTNGFIDLIDLIIRGVVLFGFVALFGLLLINLITVLTSSSTISTSLTAIIAITLSLIVTVFGYFGPISHFIPFTYINSLSVVDNTLSENLQNDSVTFSSGIVTLLIWSTLVYLVTHFLLRRKDFH